MCSGEAFGFFGTTESHIAAVQHRGHSDAGCTCTRLHSQASTGMHSRIQVSGKSCLHFIFPDGSSCFIRSGAGLSAVTSVREATAAAFQAARPGSTFSSAPGEPHLRRQPSHIGSVFTFGSHIEPTQTMKKTGVFDTVNAF